ncbi:hypothetical protein SKAU_G00259290 [Synaphobranchus kaupii]|uniref:Uncharacterized protein n=1 Tax=Synaphobranchus kaupii TaxID=118154 RepID=A0A9Q1F4J7_SYNKA|nr:hypothetical protein SKAU_G00259290 [Synaphobranchus kaupii]
MRTESQVSNPTPDWFLTAASGALVRGHIYGARRTRPGVARGPRRPNPVVSSSAGGRLDPLRTSAVLGIATPPLAADSIRTQNPLLMADGGRGRERSPACPGKAAGGILGMLHSRHHKGQAWSISARDCYSGKTCLP